MPFFYNIAYGRIACCLFSSSPGLQTIEFNNIYNESDSVSRKILARLLTAVLMSTAAIAPAAADDFQIIAEFNCDKASGTLTIKLKGGNLAGYLQQAREEQRPVFLGRDLLKVAAEAADGSYKLTHETVIRRCRLHGIDFEVAFFPWLHGRWSPTGWCAGRVGIGYRLKRNGKFQFERGADGCSDRGMVTTEVILRQGRAPVFIEKSAMDFNDENL